MAPPLRHGLAKASTKSPEFSTRTLYSGCSDHEYFPVLCKAIATTSFFSQTQDISLYTCTLSIQQQIWGDLSEIFEPLFLCSSLLFNTLSYTPVTPAFLNSNTYFCNSVISAMLCLRSPSLNQGEESTSRYKVVNRSTSLVSLLSEVSLGLPVFQYPRQLPHLFCPLF